MSYQLLEHRHTICHTVASPPPDGDHGARLPFPGFPPRELSAPEVHRETSGDTTRGGQRKAGQRKGEREG